MATLKPRVRADEGSNFRVRVTDDPVLRANQRLAGTVAGSIEQVGSSAVRAAAEHRAAAERADRLRVGMSEVELDSLTQDLLEDPEHGYLNRKGVDAIQKRKGYMEKFDKRAAKMVDDLANENQKAAMRASIEKRRTQFRSMMDRHESSQMAAVDEINRKARVANTTHRLTVMTRMGLDEDVHDLLVEAREAERLYLIGQRVGQEAAEAGARDLASTMHLSVVQSLIDADRPERAKELMDKHRNQLNAEDVDKADKAIASAMGRNMAANTALELWARATTKKPGGEGGLLIDNLRGALAELHASDMDASLKFETQKKLLDLAKADDSVRKMQDRDAIGEAKQILATGGRITKQTRLLDRLSPEGLGTVWSLHRAEMRRRSNSPTKRKEQSSRNQSMQDWYRRLPFSGRPGADKQSVDLEAAAKAFGGDVHTLTDLIEDQQGDQKSFRRDNGVSYREFQKRIETRLLNNIADEETRKKAKSYMEEQWHLYRNPDDPGAPPPTPTVEQWIAGWHKGVKVQDDPDAWFVPGEKEVQTIETLVPDSPHVLIETDPADAGPPLPPAATTIRQRAIDALNEEGVLVNEETIEIAIERLQQKALQE